MPLIVDELCDRCFVLYPSSLAIFLTLVVLNSQLSVWIVYNVCSLYLLGFCFMYLSYSIFFLLALILLMKDVQPTWYETLIGFKSNYRELINESYRSPHGFYMHSLFFFERGVALSKPYAGDWVSFYWMKASLVPWYVLWCVGCLVVVGGGFFLCGSSFL